MNMAELYLPNFLATFAQADQAAAMAKYQQRQNALAGFYRDNGAALASGDTNALGKLYEFDPQAAFGIQRQQQQDAIRAEETRYQHGRDAQSDARADRQEGRLSEEHQAKMKEYAATASAEQIATDRDLTRRGLQAVWEAQNDQDWDASADALGYPQLKGQFSQKRALLRSLLDQDEFLESIAAPTPQSPQGKFEFDKENGFVSPDAVYQTGGNTTVNVGPNGSKFTEESDKLAAQRLGEVVTQGQGAGRLIGDLQALAGLAGQINTGKGAELLTRFGPYAEMFGVDIGGLPEMQAYQSIIDRMAPAMRTPGAGSSSDFDAKQFLSSLPTLARTTEGNAIINETLQSVQRQKLAAADIAMQAQRGEITWQEADKKMAALGNPYETFNKMRDKISGGTSQAPQIGEMRKGYRFKGGDPADPNSWEKQ